MKLNMLDIAYYAKSAICNEIHITKIAISEEGFKEDRDILKQDLKMLEDDLKQVDDLINELSKKHVPNLVVI